MINEYTATMVAIGTLYVSFAAVSVALAINDYPVYAALTMVAVLLMSWDMGDDDE